MKKITLSLVITVLFTAASSTAAFAYLTTKANNDRITIGFFYSGSEVSVSGLSDPGLDYIVTITSPECHQNLKRKGKVGGVLWMNVGDLKCEKVPNLYFIQSTRKLDELLPANLREQYLLGYPAIGKHIEMEPLKDQAEKDKWFAEFVKYKESKKLFFNAAGGFQISQVDGKQKYYMEFKWPYQAPPGEYMATIYGVRDGKIVEQATSKVLVEQVGSVKLLANMAKNQGALYGILAILSAIGAGFGVGLVFGKGGGAH